MGKVGDDEFGRMILNILEKYNRAEGMIVDQESSTSYSAVLAVPGIDRIFLHNPGAELTRIFQMVKETGCMTALDLAAVDEKSAAGFYYKTQGKEAFEKSYVPDAVLSGTGAGDTMIAAFLTAMIQGYPFERCIQLAEATGAGCVAAVKAVVEHCENTGKGMTEMIPYEVEAVKAETIKKMKLFGSVGRY